MKHTLLLFFLLLSLLNFTFGQKRLSVDNLNTIPNGNELGMVRDYTNDEILTFIEISGWSSFYKENITLMPKIVARLSRNALSQLHVEAKNTWYRALQNNATEELRTSVKEKYGDISINNYKKFAIILLVLEKMDRGVKYSQ